MTDAVRRSLRTGLQLIVTLLSTAGIVTGINLVFGTHISNETFAAISATALPLVTALLNWLEDAGTIPAFLKASAPATDA